MPRPKMSEDVCKGETRSFRATKKTFEKLDEIREYLGKNKGGAISTGAALTRLIDEEYDRIIMREYSFGYDDEIK